MSRCIRFMDQISIFTLYALLLVILSRCTEIDPVNEIVPDDPNIVLIDDIDFTPTDWTEETHSKSATPDFTEVFDNTTVKRIDIVITEARWLSMLSNMTNLYGSFGATGGGGINPGGGISGNDEDPIFVPADIFYNGKQWYRVGIRFKGNSSLQSSWQQGILKLSFKLDFDEFEDDYPQIDDQRFYGFKQLNLKNNFDDESFLREKVAAEIFSKAGLVVSHTAFYTLYVDYGDGPQYFGLYTMVEEVDDTVIETQFSNDDGNLYKPEGNGASFASGTFNEVDFEKKSNEDEVDWTDIQSLYSALHDPVRTTDPVSWRSGLEDVFNLDVFLRYLAVNTVIQNWDTYGRMTQNYYLYNNPENGRFTWIPWDNNEALQEGKMGGSLELDFSDLQSGRWPLIEYLYDDEVYRATYDEYVLETIREYFDVSTMQSTYEDYASQIEEHVNAEISGYTFLENSIDFRAAISELKQHVTDRTNTVEKYLK